ncbi:unnamed protein product [Miscanthus lutarioriparius]|uniref:Uncharacterized protein n=1 Tax=Miscanthus lutarioriparius TaxID=422564 RepID=A0A811RPA7_9POAL|nr:unnamed protein product [Miscanthus lutarioriparius]
MASARQSNKFRILLMPFFATSHIGPVTDLAFHLAAARPDDVEATVAVTPANASIVQSALAPRVSHQATIKVATYPFPSVNGLPLGVENLSTVKAADAWRRRHRREADAARAGESYQRALAGPRHHRRTLLVKRRCHH